jgi:hypothetical protein
LWWTAGLLRVRIRHIGLQLLVVLVEIIGDAADLLGLKVISRVSVRIIEGIAYGSGSKNIIY